MRIGSCQFAWFYFVEPDWSLSVQYGHTPDRWSGAAHPKYQSIQGGVSFGVTNIFMHYLIKTIGKVCRSGFCSSNRKVQFTKQGLIQERGWFLENPSRRHWITFGREAIQAKRNKQTKKKCLHLKFHLCFQMCFAFMFTECFTFVWACSRGDMLPFMCIFIFPNMSTRMRTNIVARFCKFMSTCTHTWLPACLHACLEFWVRVWSHMRLQWC